MRSLYGPIALLSLALIPACLGSKAGDAPISAPSGQSAPSAQSAPSEPSIQSASSTRSQADAGSSSPPEQPAAVRRGEETDAAIPVGLLHPCSPCRGAVTPALERELTERALRTQACYNQALYRDRSQRGRVRVSIRVADDGAVCSYKVTSDEMADPDLELCVLGILTQQPLLGAEHGCVEVAVPLLFVSRPADAGADGKAP